MTALVSQAEAVAQLRLNEAALTAAQLADVMFKADQASAIIVDYLKRPFIEGDEVPPAGVIRTSDFEPSVPPALAEPWTPETVPVLVKAAILIVLTSLYDGRTGDDPLLSDQLTGILHRLRDPALA